MEQAERTEQPLRVYWQPGCSSCVKVKEFLAGLEIPYQSIDVAARPEAMEELRRLGVRTVPVVARGDQFVFAQALEDVSRFVGRAVRFDRLAPEVLMHKWQKVLGAAARNALQIPAERLAERATPGRDRSVRELAYHVFQIPEAFLKCVEEGVAEWTTVANAPTPADVTTVAQIDAYGRDVAARLARWWDALEDKSCAWPVKTYYGEHPAHQLLERSCWHSAQHARQVIAVLEGFGIVPAAPLGGDDYAGLPLPDGLWE